MNLINTSLSYFPTTTYMIIQHVTYLYIDTSVHVQSVRAWPTHAHVRNVL